MEFQGQRGDPHSAWSVGKYAKRSATIHLCSEDCQTAEGKAFTGTIVSSSTQAYAGVQTPNITVFDPPGDGPQELRNPIRTAMANVNQDGATVRIYNDAMGTSHETSTVTLGGAARDGVHAVAALTDFTKLALDTNYQATDAADGVFNPLTVREIDNNQAVAGGAAVQTVAGQGLAVADSDIKIIRTQSDTYMFLVQTSVFPTTNDNLGVVRLSKNAFGTAGADPNAYGDQVDKGYVLELINWDLYPGNENKLAEADEYFLAGLTFGGFVNDNGTRMTLLCDRADIPQNLFAYINPKLDAVNAGGNGEREITLGGQVRQANGSLTANGQRGDGVNDQNDNDKIITWNLFPATKIDVSQHGFAVATDNHCNYTVTIPNTIGYPEHKRCLIQVQSLSCHAEAHILPDHTKRLNPPYVGVEVEGLGVQNNFSSHVTLNKDKRYDGRVTDSIVYYYF